MTITIDTTPRPKMTQIEKDGRYYDHKRGWLDGSRGGLHRAIGSLAPEYPDEYERGTEAGRLALNAAMKARFDALMRDTETDDGGA